SDLSLAVSYVVIERLPMQGNGEDRANDEHLPAAAHAAGFAAPFDRSEWFDLLEVHGFAGTRRVDARGTVDATSAWLPLRVEKPGHVQGLTNWYSFAIRPLYTGEDRKSVVEGK